MLNRIREQVPDDFLRLVNNFANLRSQFLTSMAVGWKLTMMLGGLLIGLWL